MARHVITYDNDLSVEILILDTIKISEAALNKALLIAMNYLIENMEPIEHEEPE